MSYSIKITSVSNGFIIESVSCDEREIEVFEIDDYENGHEEEAETARRLGCIIANHFGLYGSKHSVKPYFGIIDSEHKIYDSLEEKRGAN